jgi:uncharacterized protein YjbI with pentapeptide repeats
MDKIPATKIVKGLKFLTHGCSTIREDGEHSYATAINQWMTHPKPAKWDGKDCGAGRWHVMARLSSEYAPANWVAWRAYGRGVVGYSAEKFGCTSIMIRPIPLRVWYRYIRRFGSDANLYDANLYGANLSGANLYGANLSGADLRNTDLSRADLRDANLSHANLYGANLYGANLYGANLSRADLSDADLRRANLYGADLRDADLSDADLSRADLYDANLYGANLYDANLYGANLYGANLSHANLSCANLSGADANEYTTFPDKFDAAASGVRMV